METKPKPNTVKKTVKGETMKSLPADITKINELKIELLKNPTKRKRIKREIARLLTMDNTQIKSGEKS